MIPEPSNIEFYDSLAENYDEMISFRNLLNKKIKLYKEIISPDIKSVADLGCGTGVDSIALAKLGLSVFGFDPSSKMIEKAKQNAKREDANAEFYNHSIDEIPKNFDDKFDLLISTGNTFANISKEKFHSSLKKCFNLLKKNEKLLIQILNYQRILIAKERIVNISQSDNETFIRFYDFHDDEIVFNILKFKPDSPGDYNLTSTKIYPYTTIDFQKSLPSIGFNDISFSSDIKGNPFNPDESKNLVIAASKD